MAPQKTRHTKESELRGPSDCQGWFPGQLSKTQRHVLMTLQTDSSTEVRRNNILPRQVSLLPLTDSCRKGQGASLSF